MRLTGVISPELSSIVNLLWIHSEVGLVFGAVGVFVVVVKRFLEEIRTVS